MVVSASFSLCGFVIMGNCASVKSVPRQVGLPVSEGSCSVELEYPLTEIVLIRLRDANMKLISKDKVAFTFPTAVISTSREYTSGQAKYTVSSKH